MSFNQPNDANVVVVTLKTFDPDNLALLFALLRRAFPHRSVLAATTEPDAFGVMGGGMQPQGHVHVLTNQLDFGLNVQEAGAASLTSACQRFSFQVLAKGYGDYQAIKVEMHDGQRVYVGASESRKDGQAAGY